MDDVAYTMDGVLKPTFPRATGHVPGDLLAGEGWHRDVVLLRNGGDPRRPRSLLRSASRSAAGEMPHRGGW